MARRPIRVDDQWQCSLSASPNQIRRGESLTFTLTLHHPSFDGLSDDDKAAVYRGGFTYAYNASNSQLEDAIARAENKPYPTLTAAARAITFNVQLPDIPDGDYNIDVTVTSRDTVTSGEERDRFWSSNAPSGLVRPTADFSDGTSIRVITPVETDSRVTLQRTFAGPTDDRALWPTIRNRTAAIGFARYRRFIDCVFSCEGANPLERSEVERALGTALGRCVDQGIQPQISIHGPYAYNVLKFATQVFLTLESGVVIRDNTAGRPRIFDIQKERIRVNDFSLTFERIEQELQNYLESGEGRLPYLNRILTNLITLDPENIEEVLPYCLGVLQYRLTSPSLIELIWSYWLEEGMLVQTMNAIARRFQNRRGSRNDPLGELEFDPLRPLNNLIWGFIQDEHNRLTVPRRAHEYHHHYGLSLIGSAVSDLDPADSRSKFIEAFHNLLSCAARFYQSDSDTTMIADAFPLLNALREVHLILAEGAHNQFGDLTWTARAEMLTIQWMLARPEMREFLQGGRYMS